MAGAPRRKHDQRDSKCRGFVRKTFDRHECMDRTPATILDKCALLRQCKTLFCPICALRAVAVGAVSESELANQTKGHGQQHKSSAGGPGRPVVGVFFSLLCTGSCALPPDRDRLRASRDRQEQQQLQPSARSCMKPSKISQFEIAKSAALRGLAKGERAGPTRADFKAAAIFQSRASLPSGALVHLAVFSPSAGLAGLRWLINRSLPIFRLRLASSSPTLGAPRQRARARVQADDLLSAMRTPSLHSQLSAAKTSKPPHLELGKHDQGQGLR
ncbi:uncharacterized protein PAN0_005c2739 [Moesziomyces antarcticus]|nr:uncharacterized protein PAN0_005c2739 [Moesziomyces antarcticus]GAK64525.1 hypothetical protein PAN0_005c2739 [Moesziomyces antarcticus]